MCDFKINIMFGFLICNEIVKVNNILAEIHSFSQGPVEVNQMLLTVVW